MASEYCTNTLSAHQSTYQKLVGSKPLTVCPTVLSRIDTEDQLARLARSDLAELRTKFEMHFMELSQLSILFPQTTM